MTLGSEALYWTLYFILHLAYHFSTNTNCNVFGVDEDARNERKRVSRMWENAYLIIKIPTVSNALNGPCLLATDSLLHSHDSALLCQQLLASEAGSP